MRMTSWFTGLLLMTVLGLPTVQAQEEEGPRRRRAREGQQSEGGQQRERGQREGGPRRGPGGDAAGPAMLMRLPIMRALDVNGDGTISAEEIADASKNLKKLDRDGDGQLTLAELRPAGGPPGAAGGSLAPRDRGAMMAQMFERRDANKDGKLTGDEIPPQMAGRLERIDANGDGAIDQEELKKMQEAMRGGRPEAGQRGRDRKPEGDGSGVKPKRPGRDS